MTPDVKTSSFCWCALCWSKPKFKWHEIWFIYLHLDQISCNWPGPSFQKPGQLQVSSKGFARHLLKSTHLWKHRNQIYSSWWRWWWWIVFAEWFTDERCLALFPARTIVRDCHHRKSPTHCEQNLNFAEPEFRLWGIKFCSCDKHHKILTNVKIHLKW